MDILRVCATEEGILASLKVVLAMSEEELPELAKKAVALLNKGLTVSQEEGKKPLMMFNTTRYDPETDEAIGGPPPPVRLSGDPSIRPLVVLEELPSPIPTRELPRLHELYEIVSREELCRRYTNYYRQDIVKLRAGMCPDHGPTYLNNCC